LMSLLVKAPRWLEGAAAPRIKVVATDIDGTITDDRLRLSLKAVEAIRMLEEAGLKVVLASGNALPVVRTLKTYLGCTGAIICEGGAIVEYRDEVRVLGSSEEARKALRELKERFGDRVQETWSNRYRLVDIALKRTIERSIVEEVVRGYPSLKLMDSGFAYHLVNRSVNKGLGLKVAAELMGVSLNEVLAVGDSETDLELLEVAGFRVALQNAPPRLKALAHHITSKPNGEGFVEAAKLALNVAARNNDGSTRTPP